MRELAPLFECEGSRATTEIMEQGVGACRQCQIPRDDLARSGTAGSPPRRTRSSICARRFMYRMLVRWTVRRNTWTVVPYRLRNPRTKSRRVGPEVLGRIIGPTATQEPRALGNACPFPDPAWSEILIGALSAKNSTLICLHAFGRNRFVASARSAHLPDGAVRNIVLVHGAFVDQTSWQLVADILSKKGYNVTLVENPLTSLVADVEATKQALAKQNGKTVLVGIPGVAWSSRKPVMILRCRRSSTSPL